MIVPSRRERGTIALEFVLLLPVVLLIIGTLVITGLRGVYSALGVHEARAAARDASIRTTQSPSAPYPTEDEICASSNRFILPGSDLTGCALTNNPLVAEEDWGTGDMVTVTLTYELTVLSVLSNYVPDAFDGLTTMSQSASVMRE